MAMCALNGVKGMKLNIDTLSIFQYYHIESIYSNKKIMINTT